MREETSSGQSRTGRPRRRAGGREEARASPRRAAPGGRRRRSRTGRPRRGGRGGGAQPRGGPGSTASRPRPPAPRALFARRPSAWRRADIAGPGGRGGGLEEARASSRRAAVTEPDGTTTAGRPRRRGTAAQWAREHRVAPSYSCSASAFCAATFSVASSGQSRTGRPRRLAGGGARGPGGRGGGREEARASSRRAAATEPDGRQGCSVGAAGADNVHHRSSGWGKAAENAPGVLTAPMS